MKAALKHAVVMACHWASGYMSNKEEVRYVASSHNIKETQEKVLEGVLERLEGTESAAVHNINGNASYEYFKKHFLVSDYSDWQEMIEYQRSGAVSVLTNTPCMRYQPTSGSTSKIKWIPYNHEFLEQLNLAVGPWLSNMYKQYPEIKKGKHYWSLSWVPTEMRNVDSESVNNDLKLLPWWKRLFMSFTMAVPEDVSLAESSEESLFATACYLVSCDDLSFISVWSPTFLMGLLDLIKDNRMHIARVLEQGQWPKYYPSLSSIKAPMNKRVAGTLLKWDGIINPRFTKFVWPKLALISAWDTSSSKVWAEKIKVLFAHADFQGKGLWATEGAVTIPYGHNFPLTFTSHFYEFENLDTNEVLASWMLKEGMQVKPILTTANGLIRYALKDRLEVTGFFNQVPCFTFMGRLDGIDLVGEKLSPDVASHIISYVNGIKGITAVTLLGVPNIEAENDGAGYVLLCEGRQVGKNIDHDAFLNKIKNEVEGMLQQHFHYQLAREVGQLQAVEILMLEDAVKFYEDGKVEEGMTRGNIKIEPLSLWRGEIDKVFSDEKMDGIEVEHVI